MEMKNDEKHTLVNVAKANNERSYNGWFFLVS